jgi:hypothetical protein
MKVSRLLTDMLAVMVDYESAVMVDMLVDGWKGVVWFDGLLIGCNDEILVYTDYDSYVILWYDMVSWLSL